MGESRQQPSPDGNDEGCFPSGADKKLNQESFLPEEERTLAGGVGPGPRSPEDPANDG